MAPLHRVQPARTRANAWADVADLAASYGVALDPWQELVLQASMAERVNGRWASRQVGLSTPRQNGKTEIIVARFLAGVLLFGERTVVVSAHRLDTVREVFLRAEQICRDTPALDSRVRSYQSALNRETIYFHGGATVRFKTRSSTGARGFAADCIILDEAQVLSAPAWAAILPTLSARPNAQAWLLGTPPTPDADGTVFTRLRTAALDGRTASMTWLEWAAERGDDPDDPATWAKANPAYPLRISPEAIEAEHEAMTAPEFARERLGIWPGAGTAPAVIEAADWIALRVAEAPADGRRAYGVRFSPDGARVALAVAVPGAAGEPVFAELVDMGPTSAGLAGLADWLAERWSGSLGVVIDGKSGAGALVEALLARGVRPRALHRPTVDEVITAHAGLVDAVAGGGLAHAGQPGLTASVDAAGRRSIGASGGWGFASRYPGGDVTPLEAVTLALYAATRARRNGRGGPTKPSTRTGGRRAVVLS